MYNSSERQLTTCWATITTFLEDLVLAGAELAPYRRTTLETATQNARISMPYFFQHRQEQMHHECRPCAAVLPHGQVSLHRVLLYILESQRDITNNRHSSPSMQNWKQEKKICTTTDSSAQERGAARRAVGVENITYPPPTRKVAQ